MASMARGGSLSGPSDGSVGHVSRGAQNAQTASQQSPRTARGTAVSTAVPLESTGRKGHKSRRARCFTPRGVKRRPAAEAARMAKISKNKRAGHPNKLDGNIHEDEGKWPRPLNKHEKFAILESVKNSKLSTEVYNMKGTGGVARKNWIANILAPARQNLAENASYLRDPCDVLADKFWKNVQRWVKSQREQLSAWNEAHNGTGSAAPNESKLTELHRKRAEAFNNVSAISKARIVETGLSDSSGACSGVESDGEYSEGGDDGNSDSEDGAGGGISEDGVDGCSFVRDVGSIGDLNDYDDYDLTQPYYSLVPLGARGSVSRSPEEVQKSMQPRARSVFTKSQHVLDPSRDDPGIKEFMSKISGAVCAIATALNCGRGGERASASATAATPLEGKGPTKKRRLTAAEATSNAEVLKFMASTTDEQLRKYARRCLINVEEE